MSSRKISDYFWGETGFTTVETWLNQTKDSSSYLAFFIRERAAIEELYAAKLQQLLKNTALLHELGTTREAWLSIRGETENLMNNSKTLSASLNNECYTPLSKFKDTQMKFRKQYLADAWKVNKENEKLKFNYTKLKEKYEKCNAETEKCQKALETAKAQGKPASELLKLTGKVQKLAKETMIFERETQEAAAKLAQYQGILAEKMTAVYDVLCTSWRTKCYQSLQKQEEDRIDFIKQHLTKFEQALRLNANFYPTACVRIKEKIEAIDKHEDIDCIVRERQTSTEKPKASDIVFVPLKREPIYDTTGTPLNTNTNSYYEAREAYQSGMYEDLHFADRSERTSGMYTPEDYTTSHAVDHIAQCRALYDYVGKDEHELDFFAGDIILIIEKDFETGWWTGEKDGRIGLIPSPYVEEL